MLKSSGAMGAATLASRVLGMVREMVYSRFMGSSWQASAFFLAYQIPNLFRRLLGEGALTAAFIPIFKEKERLEGNQAMWQAANAVISGLLVSAAAIIGLALLGISLALAVGSPSSRFSAGDIRDARYLARQLREHLDSLSEFLWSQFSPATREALSASEGAEFGGRDLRAELARELNKVITGKPIYAPSRFAEVTLSGTAQELIEEGPAGRGLVHLNRLLLEEAYPHAIARSADGFAPKTRLMLQLLRIMFPYMLLVCLAAVGMGMLNSRGHFFIPAMGATMLNVVMIASVWCLAPLLGQTLDVQIFGLAIGVLLAGVAQAAFQMPALLREGFRYRWVAPWANETVRQVLRKMVPASIGVAAFQINVLITQGFAFHYGDNLVSAFNYAVRLMELPQGVFGVSLATYLLPTLSGLVADKKLNEYRSTLLQGLSYLSFLNLLAAAMLLALAEPIVRLLFEGGKFRPQDTQSVALTLSCLAPGLLAFSMVSILARAFYALGDTNTPMKISAVCLGLNVLFALWLIHPFREAGLGLANTMSSAFNVWLLLHALRRRLRTLDLALLRRDVLLPLGAAVCAGIIAWLIHTLWDRHLGHAGLTRKLGAVFIPAAIAAPAYLVMTLRLGLAPARDLCDLALARIRKLGRTAE
jgi:putative peptidoglycan lipid II flippase